MLDRGDMFLKKLDQARGKIAKNASKFVVDGCVSYELNLIKNDCYINL